MLLVGIEEVDVIFIESRIGGLCCGGLLARNEDKVLVLESHTIAGGAAHSFEIKDFHFDSRAHYTLALALGSSMAFATEASLTSSERLETTNIYFFHTNSISQMNQ